MEIKGNEAIYEEKSLPLRDLEDMIETVSVVPTSKPTTFFNQFKIYRNGATKRFYWYDSANNSWDYVAGT